MAVRGVVEGKVVVLENGSAFADGTPVIVCPLHGHPSSPETMAEKLFKLRELFALQLPVGEWAEMEREIIDGVSGELPS